MVYVYLHMIYMATQPHSRLTVAVTYHTSNLEGGVRGEGEGERERGRGGEGERKGWERGKRERGGIPFCV